MHLDDQGAKVHRCGGWLGAPALDGRRVSDTMHPRYWLASRSKIDRTRARHVIIGRESGLP